MHTCFHSELREGISELSAEEATHVGRVLRLREGDEVRLVDGLGGVAVGTLIQVDKRRALVEVAQVERETERPQGLIMVVAPTKHTDRFEWLLEKATELGVEAVIPVWCERSERRVEKHDRWEKVIVAATKQCQRRWKPLLHEAILLNQLFIRHEQLANRLGAVAHCMEGLSTVPPREPWVSWQQGKHAAWIAIGPEGDFSPQEVEWLVEACAATPVHLGNLRLRTETAGMTAIAQFESR